MFYRRDKEPLPKDGIYLVILGLMLVNIVVGVALMLLGGEVWDNAAVSRFGSWLALLSGGFYLFFRWFGRREAARRRRDRTGGSEPEA